MSETVTSERNDQPGGTSEHDRPVSELPLPPQPDLLGPPELYFIRAAIDPLRFGQKL